jgi:uncharacterized membrane protein
MFRKYIAVTLLISIFALGTSGLLMIILNDLTFRLKMDLLHETFGVIMCISGSIHVYLNFKLIKNYLKYKKVAIAGTILSVLLIFLFVIGMNKPIDQKIILEIEKKISQLEQKR